MKKILMYALSIGLAAASAAVGIVTNRMELAEEVGKKIGG